MMADAIEQEEAPTVEDLGFEETSLEDEDMGVRLGRSLAQLLENNDIYPRRVAAIVLQLHTAHEVSVTNSAIAAVIHVLMLCIG